MIMDDRIELTTDIEKIYTAKQCLNFKGFSCTNKDCTNIACPLNKKWRNNLR